MLREVIKADSELANTDAGCWIAEVREGLGNLPGGQEFVDCMKGKKEIDVSKFIKTLHADADAIWIGMHGRKVDTCANCCAAKEKKEAGHPCQNTGSVRCRPK